MSVRSWSCAALVLAVGLVLPLALPKTATAAPTVFATKPQPSGEDDDFALFVGGIDTGGRSLKLSSIELLIDGKLAGGPPLVQSFSEWATLAAEASTTWRPPLAVGLVYLWIEGVPTGVLDGIHAFFQRVPSRTPVFPTVYGRMRQGRARLSASEISRLDEVPHLEGYRPNLIEAVRLNLGDLAAEKAPLKILLLVTDGRDFADPKGDGPGDFGRLGRDLRSAGITPLVVGFPPPAADAVQGATNLGDLRATSGGFVRLVDQPEELENALESLGQAIGDLQRVRFGAPWSSRLVGGSHRITLRLATARGQRLNADAGVLDLHAGKALWFGIGGGAAAVAVAVMLVAVARRRRAEQDDEPADDDVLAAAHDLVRRGAPPRRAAEELVKMFPDTVRDLLDIDEETLTDPRYPYFRTRPGRQRLQEIQNLLANKRTDRSDLGPVAAEVIATALTERLRPTEVAVVMAARASVDEWTAFAGLPLDQLAEALRHAARRHPELGTPRARGIAVAIQDALRAQGAERGMVIGWLVRSQGPGRRGETLRLGDGRTAIGRDPGCQVRLLEDPAVVTQHAEITASGDRFVIRPLAGPLTVEGAIVSGERVLLDGDTIGIGAGLYVFKSATAGNLLPRSPATGVARERPTRARRRAGA